MGPFRFLARVIIGLLFVGHGTQKLFGWFGGGGLDGTSDMFDSIGLSGRPRCYPNWHPEWTLWRRKDLAASRRNDRARSRCPLTLVHWSRLSYFGAPPDR